MPTNWNWLQGTHDHAAKPVFAGQKLVVVGGSSGMGQQTVADALRAIGGTLTG
jgi:uncharacterized protein YoaH (UPF0181 family)